LSLRSLKRGLGGGIDGVAQEYFVCSEEDAVPLPANMSYEKGATMPVAYATAWSSLFSHHPKLQSGQTVLCLGTGGVSLCAAQVCLSSLPIIALLMEDRSGQRSKSYPYFILAEEAGSSKGPAATTRPKSRNQRRSDHRLLQDRHLGSGGQKAEWRQGSGLCHRGCWKRDYRKKYKEHQARRTRRCFR
jgi:hypothetical protein